MACSWARRTAALAVVEDELLLVVLEADDPLLPEPVLLDELVDVVREAAVVVVEEVVLEADAFKVPQSFSRVSWHCSCSSRLGES